MTINQNIVCPDCKADNCSFNDTCISCNAPLVGDEVRVLIKTAELWEEFVKLPSDHPDEQNEIRLSIHRLQDIIAVRMARRLTRGIYA